MFSENNRISGRQAFRLLTFDLLGLSTLLLPTVLGQTAGPDGIFSIALGVAATVWYLRYLERIVRESSIPFPCYLEQKLGKVCGVAVQIGYLVYLVVLAGYTAYLFADVVLESLLREESFELVLVILLGLVAYGLWGGIEGRARVYEILFWLLILPLFLMLFFAMDGVETNYWSPVFMTGAGEVLTGAYAVFACFSILFLLTFLGEYVRDKEALIIAGRRSIYFVGGIHGVLYLVLLGIFGANALGTMEYPAVTMMSTVKIAGGFLKRADAFMFAVWFFTLYALLGSCIFYASGCFLRLHKKYMMGYTMEEKQQKQSSLRERADEEKKKDWFLSLAVIIAAGVIAYNCYKMRTWLDWCQNYLLYIGTPFVVIVPIVLGWIADLSDDKKQRRLGRRVGMWVVVLLASSILSGCATSELEDRNFPIEMAVEGTDAFAQEYWDEQKSGNRVIDYSHLKLMIISRDFIEDEAKMQDFLQTMEEQKDVPRNTYVVVAENPQEVMDTQEALGDSVGNYLEMYFENVSQVDKQAYPTLGMLYQEADNRTETLFIPYVSVEEDRPVVTNYYVWKRGGMAGVADTSAALLSFFTQNRMEEYRVTLEDGVMVNLSDAHNEIRFEEREGIRTVVVQIACNGEVVNRRQSSETEVQQLQTQIEEYMNGVAEQSLRESAIDVTNSFKELGGGARDWYVYYQGQDALYEQDIHILYQMSIDWVNL